MFFSGSMNADHATRFLTFRSAILLSHFTLVSFRITFVLFALAQRVFCHSLLVSNFARKHGSVNLFSN